MNLLLDTHVWLWAHTQSARLGAVCRQLLSDPSNTRWVSSVSTLEIARLVAKGRLNFKVQIHAWIEQSQKDLRLDSLDLDHLTAIEAYQLPGTFHSDPADRLLVATARRHGWTLVTADRKILAYERVNLIRADS